jgi:hypothetical protein
MDTKLLTNDTFTFTESNVDSKVDPAGIDMLLGRQS